MTKIDPCCSKRGEVHKIDADLFKQYPSPMHEEAMKIHYSHINHTTTFYGPMLYWLARMIGAHTAVEIGVAQGYSSFFLAHAINDNNVRFQMKGEYVAIDINNKMPLFQPAIDEGMPIRFIHKPSLEVTDEDLGIKGRKIDLLFQDGWHNTEYCKKEMEKFYPMLQGEGKGYLILHDVYSFCEEYYKWVKDDPRWDFEMVRFFNNYGLAICRKMEGYDYDKVHWPEGDQKAENGFVL